MEKDDGGGSRVDPSDSVLVTDELRRQRLWFLHNLPASTSVSNSGIFAPAREIELEKPATKPQPTNPAVSTASVAPVQLFETNKTIWSDDEEATAARVAENWSPAASAVSIAPVQLFESNKTSWSTNHPAQTTNQSYDIRVKSEQIEVHVRTTSGATFSLRAATTDSLSDLISTVKKIDYESAAAGRREFVVMTSDNRVLASKKSTLATHNIRSGDTLYLRFKKFPPYYMMLPTYRRLNRQGSSGLLLLLDILLSLFGSFLIMLAAVASIPIGNWWSDSLSLDYRVPLTFETLAIAVNAAVLGPYLGLGSVLLYWLAMVVGLEVMAGGRSGPSVMYCAAAGYLWGFALAALVAGKLCQRGWDRGFISSYCIMVIIPALVYLLGFIWLPFGISLEYDLALNQVSCHFGDGCVGNLFMWGIAPYIMGDIIKSVLGTLLLPLGWRFFAHLSKSRVQRILQSTADPAQTQRSLVLPK